MYIKNQVFKDEDTLQEMLFDFSLGNPSAFMQALISETEKELEANETFMTYMNSLQDEDDKSELYIEERDMILSDKLLSLYDQFEVVKAKLYGVKDGKQQLLYEIDLV